MSDMSITVIYHIYVSDCIVPMTKDSVDFFLLFGSHDLSVKISVFV